MRKNTDSTKLIEQRPNQITNFLSYTFWWMFGGEVRSTSKFCHSGPFPPNNFVTGRKERRTKIILFQWQRFINRIWFRAKSFHLTSS